MVLSLNKYQKEAVMHLDGPCLVTSCPGSGNQQGGLGALGPCPSSPRTLGPRMIAQTGRPCYPPTAGPAVVVEWARPPRDTPRQTRTVLACCW